MIHLASVWRPSWTGPIGLIWCQNNRTQGIWPTIVGSATHRKRCQQRPQWWHSNLYKIRLVGRMGHSCLLLCIPQFCPHGIHGLLPGEALLPHLYGVGQCHWMYFSNLCAQQWSHVVHLWLCIRSYISLGSHQNVFQGREPSQWCSYVDDEAVADVGRHWVSPWCNYWCLCKALHLQIWCLQWCTLAIRTNWLVLSSLFYAHAIRCHTSGWLTIRQTGAYPLQSSLLCTPCCGCIAPWFIWEVGEMCFFVMSMPAWCIASHLFGTIGTD